ncbi:DUF167 family protein [Aurantimonas sp. VKM B-3413]|uniref:DUF167 domain-containing protein n=1 Tax=Aurantimonas sp. VKM B-3413 TaxID=2779401 RepID=UPI001E40AE9F|nr:DUF167 family protein [Aurantimonas sp. VKM B-3413]MCB8837439.1 DUF167 family protein [Aurantimonas sp. VKM B-3413]
MAGPEADAGRFFKPAGDDLLVFVRLTPRSDRDALTGTVADAAGAVRLAARVRAVPEAGKANAALIALLSKTLKLPKSRLALVAGETQRTKTVRIAAASADLVAALEKLR